MVKVHTKFKIDRSYGSGLLLQALFVFVFTLGIADPLSSQVMNMPSFSEQKPTPRDPRYKAPNIPPQLRKQYKVAPDDPSALLLNPQGDISIDSYSKIMQSKDEKKREAESLRWQRDVKDVPGGEERVILEKSLLRQFGSDDFPHQWRKDVHYEESPFRRFEITFFTSLPITMGAAYAISSALKTSSGESPTVFTGPQTAAMIFVGLFSAGSIAYYDLNEWKKLKNEDMIHHSLNGHEAEWNYNGGRPKNGQSESIAQARMSSFPDSSSHGGGLPRNNQLSEFHMGWTWQIQ